MPRWSLRRQLSGPWSRKDGEEWGVLVGTLSLQTYVMCVWRWGVGVGRVSSLRRKMGVVVPVCCILIEKDFFKPNRFF